MITSSRWTLVLPFGTLAAAVGLDSLRPPIEMTAAAVPVVASLTPQGVSAGSPGFQLVVDGSRFDATAQVRWNGAQRPTAFVSATRLVATISALDVAAAQLVQVTVVNPVTGGGTSNAVTFPIANAIPAIASLVPPSAPLRGEDFGLIVNGARFVQGSVVRLNGAARATTFVSATRVVARVLAADLAAPGTASISVVNPAPGGGPSVAEALPIELMTPTINVLTPALRQVGLGAFALRVRGSNFIRASVVRWNGATRATTWLSPSELDATIPETDVDAVGTADVSVAAVVPNVGSRVSASSSFSIASPRPVVSGVPTPLPVVRLEPVQMSFPGSDFMPRMVVRVNGASRPTTVVSPNLVRVTLDAADVAQAAQIGLRFENPAPTMGVATASLGVVNPMPVATGIDPQNVFVGSQAITLTVTGSRFVPGATVQANGSARPTTFVSPTQLRAAIPAGDLAQGGGLAIRVVTPAPGGGTSATLSLGRLYQSIRASP